MVRARVSGLGFSQTLVLDKCLPEGFHFNPIDDDVGGWESDVYSRPFFKIGTILRTKIIFLTMQKTRSGGSDGSLRAIIDLSRKSPSSTRAQLEVVQTILRITQVLLFS